MGDKSPGCLFRERLLWDQTLPLSSPGRVGTSQPEKQREGFSGMKSLELGERRECSWDCKFGKSIS